MAQSLRSREGWTRSHESHKECVRNANQDVDIYIFSPELCFEKLSTDIGYILKNYAKELAKEEIRKDC